MKTINSVLLCSLSCALVLLSASACGRGTRQLAVPGPSAIQQSLSPAAQSAATPDDVTWPTSLPADRLQPWEKLDADGFVIPRERGCGRAASAINEFSEFVSGVERFSEAGDVTDLDEASRLGSGAAGATHE